MRPEPRRLPLNSHAGHCRAWQSVALAVAFAFCSFASAEPQSPPARTVDAGEQRARDSDRVVVLSQELRKSEDQLAVLTRRKAERLAASDPQGAAEAEEQHRRTLDDVAALRRELGMASKQASAASDDARATLAAKAGARATAPIPAKPSASTAAPWWDVYGQGRSPAPSTPISQAPATSAAPTPVSGRRLE